MPLLEDRSAAFIVRVWCESGEAPGVVRAWRGSIEHVASGERSFFTELDAVIAFMTPHLVRLGIEEPSRFWERMDDVTGLSPAPIRTAAPPVTAAAAPAASATASRKPPRAGR